MTLKRKTFVFAVVSILVAGGLAASSALQAADPSQQTGPVYSIEGAWFGMTTFPTPGLGPQPTLDTFVSNVQRPGREGTFLCTTPAVSAQLGTLTLTPSGHGNWVQIGTNTYGFTAERIIMSGTAFAGLGRFWGTITAVSDSELTGTMNAQLYAPDGTPISGVATATIERHRVEVIFEQ